MNLFFCNLDILTAILFIFICSFVRCFCAVLSCSKSCSQAALILYSQPVDRTAVPVVGEYFFLLYDILRNLPLTNLIQLLMSAVTIAVLIGVKMGINERFKHRLKVPAESSI